MITIVDSGRSLRHEDLLHIEATIQASLPLEYREFLRAHNGGRPCPDTIDIHGYPWHTTDVCFFYGVMPENESCDILWNLESLVGCKENKLLPIASDSGSNQFILVMSEKHHGQVYYFEFTGEMPIPYFVANDFNEFLGKLREPTPEELGDIDAATSSSDEPASQDEPIPNDEPTTPNGCVP